MLFTPSRVGLDPIFKNLACECHQDVLGLKFGYVRGLGLEPKPPPKTYKISHASPTTSSTLVEMDAIRETIVE